MPALKKIAALPQYGDLRTQQQTVNPGDRRDCSVVALAAVTGVPYATALEALRSAGRKDKCGIFDGHMKRALAMLGFKAVRIDMDAIKDKFPEPHRRVLKNLTTHHPRRFPGTFPTEGKYLMWVRGHVAAFVDGNVLDWSINSSLRISHMEQIVRIEK